jgi:hypothetical protein
LALKNVVWEERSIRATNDAAIVLHKTRRVRAEDEVTQEDEALFETMNWID